MDTQNFVTVTILPGYVCNRLQFFLVKMYIWKIQITNNNAKYKWYPIFK